VNVAAVADSLAGADSEAIAKTLATLSDDDLLILRGDSIELAYPFSTSPTARGHRRDVPRRVGSAQTDRRQMLTTS